MKLALCQYLIKQEAKERQIRKPDSVRQLIAEQPSPDENETAHKQADLTQLIVEGPKPDENETAHKRLRFVN